MNTSFPLTTEQDEIAKAPPDQALIVLAPPGTGKTHTVVGRIANLIQAFRLHPAQDLAVLCFTRAAVKEIVDRLDQLVEEERFHDDLRFVTVRTFDSFATRLLITAQPDLDLNDSGYDERIRFAVQELADPKSGASRIVARIRHLIVDEIQDLVGVRAELVTALLKRISGGYTLLGDPAQAIYGFALKEEGGMSSDDLLEWVRNGNPRKNPTEKTLTENHRSKGKMTGFAAGIREEILRSGTNDMDALLRLQEIVSGLESSGNLLKPTKTLSEKRDGSICVLCRTNGEVLQVASLLSRDGIQYHLRPRTEDAALPSWVARVLGTWEKKRIPENLFLNRWSDLIGAERGPDPDRAWRWLKRVEGQDDRSLNIDVLANRLYQGQRLPDDADAFLQPDGSQLLLSTIHSAKGREFDHVVILPPQSGRKQTEPLEEARILYVAATRARERLTNFERDGIPNLWSYTASSGRRRWLANHPRNGFHFVELGLPKDVDVGSSVNVHVNPDRSKALGIQNHLWEGLRPGDVLKIYKERKQYGRRWYTFFRIYSDEDSERARVLGQLSRKFKADLSDALNYLTKGERFRYPSYFEGIRVSAVVSEVLGPYPQDIHSPYSNSRFCLGLRLRGMGYLWKRK